MSKLLKRISRNYIKRVRFSRFFVLNEKPNPRVELLKFGLLVFYKRKAFFY